MAQVIDGYSQLLSHSIHLVYFQCSCWSVVFYRKLTPAQTPDIGLKPIYIIILWNYLWYWVYDLLHPKLG